jgi:acyl carrier protein
VADDDLPPRRPRTAPLRRLLRVKVRPNPDVDPDSRERTTAGRGGLTTDSTGERWTGVEKVIQEFVRTNLVDDFDGEDPLAAVKLDSLALEQLIDHLEQTYQILLEGTDFARWNFISVPIAATMIEARRQATDLARERQRSRQV